MPGNNSRLVLALSFALVLVGCATVHETYTPDGRKAYTLNCSGFARGWDKCMGSAGDLCGAAGYDVIDRSDETAASIGGNSNTFFGGQTNERSMEVACKR